MTWTGENMEGLLVSLAYLGTLVAVLHRLEENAKALARHLERDQKLREFVADMAKLAHTHPEPSVRAKSAAEEPRA